MSALLLEKSRVEDFWLRCAVFYYFPPLSNPSLESWPPATSRLPQRWSMCAQGARPRLWADRQTSSSTGTRSEGDRKVPGPGPSPSSRVPHNSDSHPCPRCELLCVSCPSLWGCLVHRLLVTPHPSEEGLRVMCQGDFLGAPARGLVTK